MSNKQNTIAQSIAISGTGLHTGAYVNMTFIPAEANSGIVFQRIDLPGEPTIPADADYVVEVSRGTTLGKGDVKVHTVEHVLAALTGLGIDNVLITLDGPETPIMDGSAKDFVNLITTVGVSSLDADRNYIVINEPIKYYDKDKDVEMIAIPANDYKINVMVDYDSQVLGTQHATLEKIADFKDEFASSRTFCFLHELEALLKNNLIKGGDLSNAIVVVDQPVDDKELSDLSGLFNMTDIKVEQGILNNIKLRHQNEPARHKLLDVVGDLTLVGKSIKGHIIASKPGHSTNVEFAKLIKQQAKKAAKPYHYNPNDAPIFDSEKIMEWLPHRHPFLYVDKIISMTSTEVIGVKNITFNESFFKGHFPGNPVMPGVLQIEGMAQCGGILCLSLMDDPSNYWTYFLKIDNAKFKDKVVPGDTLVYKLELLEPIRRGICVMKGSAYVGTKLVCEAHMMAQLAKKN